MTRTATIHNTNHSKHHTMKKVIFAIVFIGALWYASEFDKEVMLLECVQHTDGSDSECDSCYKLIYGTYPTH